MLGISSDLIGAAATLYGVGAAATALLQARQIVRSRRSCDVSARFLASYVGGYAIWLLYGASMGSGPLILVDVVGLLCGGLTLAATLALRGSLLRPSSWNSCPPVATPVVRGPASRGAETQREIASVTDPRRRAGISTVSGA